MSFELLEELVTGSRVVGVSMEIFEGKNSTKEGDSFLCKGEFWLNCGLAIEIP